MSALIVWIVAVLASLAVHAYDFTNLQQKRHAQDVAALALPLRRRGDATVDGKEEAQGASAPLGPVYALSETVLQAAWQHHRFVAPPRLPPCPRGGLGGWREGTLPLAMQEDAVQYNISSLGHADPFRNASTKLDYDHAVEIEEALHNRKGAMEMRLNGTLAGVGSVGAVSSMGWHGAAKAQDKEKERWRHAHRREGLSGIWLAFTARNAITGGYMLQTHQATTSNNVVYANITVRTNITIDAQGHYAVTVVVGQVDREEEVKGHRRNQTSRVQPSCSHDAASIDAFGPEAAFAVQCIGAL